MKKSALFSILSPVSFLVLLIVLGTVSVNLSVKRQRDIHYIKTEEGLKSINNDLSGHYVIDTESIKLSKDWKPIGDKKHPFTGTLDCNYSTIYCSGFNQEYVQDSANKGEVLLGLFAVNEGTIKHLNLYYASEAVKLDSSSIDKNYKLICGSACALNYGYISMCFVSSTPSIETNSNCKNIVFGGISGENYKQIRCCSVNNAVSIKADSTHIVCGGIAGLCYKDSLVEYCIRNGFNWVNSNFSEEIICSQCIGISKGGAINNVSITSNDISATYKTFSYINSSNVTIGGLVGFVDNCVLSVNCINMNTSFEMRDCLTCNFGFLFGRLNGSKIKIEVKNIVLTGKFSNEYSTDYACGYICSSLKGFSRKVSSIYSYSIQSSFQLNQKDLVKEKSFTALKLSDVEFDPACWKKGQYSFILDIEKLK